MKLSFQISQAVHKHAIKAAFILGVGALMLPMMIQLSFERNAEAAVSSNYLYGYAWSETIGWLSLSGSTYGISIAADGTLSGYAWSDNIGWVSANSSDLTGCPSGTCSAYIDENGALQGWLRALAGGTAQSGGWDGFISLSGNGYGPSKQSDGSFNCSTCYAWGSTVVGWLDFRYASTDYALVPTAELKVRKIGDTDWQDSLTIAVTDQIELGWNQSGAPNTDSCEAIPPTYGFSTGGATSGVDSDVEEPVGNTSSAYGVMCYDPSGGQLFDTITVTTEGGVGAQFVPCPGESALPDFVQRGQNATACFELGTNNPGMCVLKAGDVDVLSPVGNTTSYTQQIVGEVNYTLECTGGDSDTLQIRSLIEAQET